MSMSLLTITELLKEANISRATLYRLIEEGLPYHTAGTKKKLFELQEVNEFLAKRKDDVGRALVVGEEYTNNEIVEILKVGVLGAMRKSNSKNALVLISYHAGMERIYEDYWKDNILYYTGVGQIGNQDITAGQNRTLAESDTNGITVYLFEMFSSQKYQYRGIVRLAGTPFQEIEPDANGEKRLVWKFPLKLVNEKDYLQDDFMEIEEEKQMKEFDVMPRPEIVATAEMISQPVNERIVTTRRVQRNPIVIKYVKMRANGYCELCGKKAPFEYNGEPYLQYDHLIPVSAGGKESIDNIVALCPNCNAMKAKIVDEKIIGTITENVQRNEERLRKELEGDC